MEIGGRPPVAAPAAPVAAPAAPVAAPAAPAAAGEPAPPAAAPPAPPAPPAPMRTGCAVVVAVAVALAVAVAVAVVVVVAEPAAPEVESADSSFLQPTTVSRAAALPTRMSVEIFMGCLDTPV
jgi:hypothetical protein